MKKKRLLLGGGIVLCIFILSVAGYFILRPNNPAIEIGAIISLSGYGSEIKDVSNAMGLAVEEINNQGGIEGNTLHITIVDSKSDPRIAIEEYRKLLSNKEPIMMCATLSSVGIALAPLAEQNRKPLICLVATNPRITQGRDWVYSFYPTAEHEVPPILSVLKMKNVQDLGMIYLNDPYGRSVYDEVKQRFGEEEKTLEAHAFEISEEQFGRYIEKLMKKEALYMVGFGNHLSAILAELRERKYKGIILSTSTASAPSFRNNPQAHGIYVAAPIIYREDYKFIEKIRKKYEKKFQKGFDHYAATGYEFIKMISSLLENSGISENAFHKSLQKGFIYPGIFGDNVLQKGTKVIHFPLYPAQIREGQLIYSGF